VSLYFLYFFGPNDGIQMPGGLLKNPVLGTDLAFSLGTALWE
jgi:hypothetical protein